MKASLFLLTLLCAGALAAHDIETEVNLAPPAVILRTTYAVSEPAAYADVLIYSPSNSEREYQNGRTDSNGVFSFVPDEAGDWKVVVDDGMGHRQDLTISVDADGLMAIGNHAAQMPTPWKLVTGLSVILGMTGLLYGYRSYRSKRFMAAR